MYTNNGRQYSRGYKKYRRKFLLILLAIIAGCLLWNMWNGIVVGENDKSIWTSAGNADQDQMAQLKMMISDYPELSDVVENSDKYPKEIIELFLKNQETVSYLVDYPVESIKKHEVDVGNELKKGEIPLLIQWDERWGYESYGSGLIGWTGCGPTCLSMAVVGLTGKEKWTPDAVARFSEGEGYYMPGSGTSWSLMSEGAARLGVSSREISLSESAMRSELELGHVIICSVGPGDFTTEGHYILIRGYDNGAFFVNDPNSRIRSGETWTYEQLSPQIKNLWAISAS